MQHLPVNLFGVLPVPMSDVLASASCDGGNMGAFSDAFQQSIAAGRMAYDGARAAQCQALGRAGAADSGTIACGIFGDCFEGDDAGLIAFCTGALSPLVPVNGACSMTEECQGDTYCAPSGDNACSGTCVPRLSPGAACDIDRDLCLSPASCGSLDGGQTICLSPWGLGQDCSNTGVGCGPGLVCQQATSLCVKPAGLAQPCLDVGAQADDCAPGLDCVQFSGTSADGGINAACEKEVPLGSNCQNDTSLGLATCANTCAGCLFDGGAPTAANPGTCQLLGGVGASCTADVQCLPFLTCSNWFDAGSAGTCVLQPRTGEQCADLQPSANSDTGDCLYSDNFCARASATATSGICTNFPVLNQACGNTFDLSASCQTGYCLTPADGGVRGICTLPARVGQPCPGNVQCDTGLVCAGADGGTETNCVALPAAGSPCFLDSSGNYDCAANTWCQLDAGVVVDAGQVDAGVSDGGFDGGFDGGAPQVIYYCQATKPAGAPCADKSECQSNFCDSVRFVCSTPCTQNYVGCGGCTNGSRQMSVYLIFSAVLFPILRNRRRRKKSRK